MADEKGRAVACFGEMLLRLSAPGGEALLQSSRLNANFGGAEANVSVALARFGHPARLVTTLPENGIGEAARAELRRHGVDISCLRWAEGRMGLYFLTPGAVLRPSEVLYDRAASAFALTGAEAYDFDAALEGCAWLHLSGITPAVSAAATQAALAAVRAADRLGVKVSFDGNYRAKLWAAWGGEAQPVLRELLSHAEVLFGDHRDLSLILGGQFDQADPIARRTTAAEAAFNAFPRLQRMACTLRTETAISRQGLAGFLADRGQAPVSAPELTLEGVVDRIGAGDAFAAGILHGSICDLTPVETLRFALAAAAHKHSIPGDFSYATRRDIDAALAETSLHVRR
jgi:2-dehydro-3-deoxygluconokinase